MVNMALPTMGTSCTWTAPCLTWVATAHTLSRLTGGQ
jgi:hypothetical protein